MITNYKFLIILFFLSSYCYSQIMTATYKQEIEISSDDEIKNKKDARFSSFHHKLMKEANDIAKNLEYQLDINRNTSLFFLKDFLVKDDKQHLLKLATSQSSGIFYNENSTNTRLWQNEAFGKTYLINLPQIKWKLTSDEKIINGFSCKKATTYKGGDPEKDKVIAWYTTDIAANFGPAGYSGLPGLIVQLKIKDKVFTLKEIDDKKKNKIKKPTKGDEIDLNEYYQLFSRAKGNVR
ncbi:MAG: GLPGLI family protein [Flavobacteriaceae bacterium]